MLVALAIWSLVIVIEKALHNGPVFLWLTEQAYSFLQLNLPLSRRPDYPVVLIDISRVRSTEAFKPIAGLSNTFYRADVEFTSRPMLSTLLKALAKHSPSAIGIDVDFSPLTHQDGGDGEPAPHQLQFLD